MIYIHIVKHRASDAAGGKAAVMKTGKGKVRSVWHTVNGYAIKIGFCKKIRRETVFCRMIEYLLVNDF